jgi:hypothetical protein
MGRLLRAVLSMLLLAMPALAQPGSSTNYPQKTVRVIVPFPAGGANDALCRIVADKLSTEWKQPVIVDNKPGAGGNVGAEVAYRAEPDGHTLLCAPPPPLAINHNLYKSLPYDWSKFAAITVLAMVPNVITARADFPRRIGQGAGGLRQGPSRQGDLCQPGQWLDLAPDGGNVLHHGRYQAGARALQGRGSGPGRPDGGPGRYLFR